MTENERIIKNANATMSMENMPFTDLDYSRGMDCLEGKITFQEAIKNLIEKYSKEQAV